MLLDSVQAIRFVAERLDALTERMVFLGGATLGLLVTEPGAAAPRPTRDVDLIVEVTMREYLDNSFRSQLLNRGFREAIDGGLACGWEIEGTRVDIMPTTRCSRSQQSLVSGSGCSGTALPVFRRTEYSPHIPSLLFGNQARGLRQSRWRRLLRSPRP